MFGKVFDRIESLKTVATKADKKIIDGLKRIKAEEIIYMSITELAGKLGVSETAVMRFCRKLDYSGFQDFKLSLSQEIGNGAAINGRKSYAQNIANDMVDSVIETYKQLDGNEDACKKTAELIVSSRRVCAFGVGNSAIAPTMIKHRLLRADIPVETASDTHVQAIIASNLKAGDAVILVSVSGATKDIINIAEIAKQNGAAIVVITNYDKSPLVKYADYSLFVCRKEGASEGGSLATIVAQAYVIDCFCAEVFNLLGEKSKEANIKAAKAVSDKSL